MTGFNYKKATQLLAFFAIKEGGTINKMKAIKLVWLCDRLHLRRFGRTITGDVYFAMPNGPVASTTRDLLEINELTLSEVEIDYVHQFLGKFDKYDYSCIRHPDFLSLSETDRNCAETVFGKYGHLDKFQLSRLSHAFPEWKRYEKGLNAKISSRYEIDINDFFTNIDDKSTLFIEDEEYLEVSKSMYKHHLACSSVL